MRILKLFDNGIRLGNIIYYILYYGQLFNRDELIIYHNSNHIDTYRNLFKHIKFRYINRLNKGYDYELFDNILNSNIDKCIIDYYINYQFLNSLKLPIDEEYCAIHCRFGDYLDDTFNHAFKAYSKQFHEYIINDEEIQKYKNIIYISDDIDMCKSITNNILSNKNIIYYHEDLFHDFNILVNANCIVGSCSTFSFAGFLLNKKNIKFYVEYPYIKKNNLWGWPEFRHCNLYNHENIIKIHI